jgi:hypothetical protein
VNLARNGFSSALEHYFVTPELLQGACKYRYLEQPMSSELVFTHNITSILFILLVPKATYKSVPLTTVGQLILCITIAYPWNRTHRISGNVMKMLLLPFAINILLLLTLLTLPVKDWRGGVEK